MWLLGYEYGDGVDEAHLADETTICRHSCIYVAALVCPFCSSVLLFSPPLISYPTMISESTFHESDGTKPKTPTRANSSWPLTPPPTSRSCPNALQDGTRATVHPVVLSPIPSYFAHLNKVMEKPLLSGPVGNVSIPLSSSTSANPPGLDKEPLFRVDEEEEEQDTQMVCPPSGSSELTGTGDCQSSHHSP
jgi:hypothetical protein